jgi:hypothetical protein
MEELENFLNFFYRFSSFFLEKMSSFVDDNGGGVVNRALAYHMEGFEMAT